MEILFPGNPRRAALDELQAAIGALREQMRTIERAPYAQEDVRADIRKALERAQKTGYARRALSSFGRFRVGGSADLPDLTWEGVILLLGVEEVEKRLLKLNMAEPGERGLPLAQREKRLAELQAKLEQLEIDEEREVLRLKAEGHRVPRRADVRADLLLGLWQQMSGPAERAA